MSVVEKSIRLYAWKNNYQVFEIVEGEVDSRVFEIQLFDTTMPLNLASSTVRFFASKPDGTHVFDDCEILDALNGKVRVVIGEQMTAVPGDSVCWIQVLGYDGTDLRFTGMTIRVADCSLNSAVRSADDFPALVNAARQANAAATAANSAADNANSAAANIESSISRVDAAAGRAETAAEDAERAAAAASDVEEMAQSTVIDELAKRGQLKPEFANNIEECTDTSKLYVLPDGYIYAYMIGKTSEVFTDVLKDVGYTEDMRINSSGGIVGWTNTDADVTGYIAVKPGDIIRVKNMPIPSTYTSGAYWNSVGSYDSNKTFITKTMIHIDTDYPDQYGMGVDAVVENGNVVQFTVKEATFGSNVAYIVINAKDITDESEVYVNSTIVSGSIWRNTGHAFVPADYEDRIIANERATMDHESRLKTLEANEDNAGVPDYWLDELDAKTDEIQQAMEAAGQNKSAFLWYTDAHWPNSAKVSPALLDYLIRNTSMNKVNFGGDIVGDPNPYSHENIKYVYEWRKAIAGLPNHHSVPGNHDLNHNTTDVRSMAYAFLLASEESADKVCGDGLYYYIDSPSEKTRYIYLDYMTNNHDEMVAQGRFIVDAIKGVQDGWHIVMIAHRWFQYSSASTPTVGSVPLYETDILSVLDAYNDRKTRAESNYFGAQDFTGAKGRVEFCIGGHIHIDHDFETAGGIQVIITASDTNQERSPDDTEDSGTKGTITEAAVYGIVADYTNSKIQVVGVGRGGSRVISI